MKQVLLFALIIQFSSLSILYSQSHSVQDKVKNRAASTLLKTDANNVKRADFNQTYYKQLGLTSEMDLSRGKVIEGQNGWTRIRMQQEYQGLRVVGASYILHEKNGYIQKASGDLLPHMAISTKPSIKNREASDAAIQYVNSKLLSMTEGSATVLPEWDIDASGLVVMDRAYPAFSGNYVLAYHIVVSDLDGFNQYKESIYVDAQSARIIEAISEIAHTSVIGIANTRYYGEQTIVTDSISEDLYVLRDSTRGGGIITVNGSRNDFVDEDNFWENFGDKEEVGPDAHYCASSYYDYMLAEFDWSGLDGEGFEVRSRVFGAENNRVNATWNGRYATFYSGDCDEYGPLTTMDVVGHEFAHGFTEFTSGLIYRNESGALNESISDIFGKALEFTYDEANSDWLIGSRFLLEGNDDGHFRDMADPNTKNHPKLYAGVNWEFGTRDNGGVHINSGVFNYWFYLLSEGVADTNELGVDFDVPKIGFEKAAAIVFTMNTAYLTESSTYTKAVTASVEAVKDLYGENSPEMVAILEAWKAVGLYTDSGDYDLRVELVENRASVCVDALDTYELEVYVINVGANPYNENDELILTYAVEEELRSEQVVILQAALNPGDTLFYTFPQPVMLESGGRNYDILVALEATATLDPNNDNGEIIITNNNSEGRITTTQISGLDMRVSSLSLTSAGACEISDESQLRLGIQNTGCSEIPEGDYPMTIFTAGSQYDFLVRLPFNLRAGSFATIFDLLILPAEIENGDSLRVEFFVTDDVVADNNSMDGQFLFLEPVSEGYLEDFTDFDVFKSIEIFIDPDFRADALVNEVNGNSMLVITGTNDEPFRLENCEDEDLFFRENYQKTDLEMCVNTADMVNPTLSFDLIQYRSDALIEDINQGYAVMVKVSIDNEYDITYPLIYDQAEGESVKHQFALPEEFSDELLIEVVTLRGNGAEVFDNNFEDGDFALIDNVRLSSGPVSTESITGLDDIQVFPNPSSGAIHFSTKQAAPFDLFIYDGVGRLQSRINAKYRASWDSQPFVEGIYFYEIIFTDGAKRQGKLVVNKK